MCDHVSSLDLFENYDWITCDNCHEITCHWCYVIITYKIDDCSGCDFCLKWGRWVHAHTDNICQWCLDNNPEYKKFKMETL